MKDDYENPISANNNRDRCAITTYSPNMWWAVDLQGVYAVTSLEITSDIEFCK